jgi:hypothetical protein
MLTNTQASKETIQKIPQKDFDKAFDELSYFLLEKYREYKELLEVSEPDISE